MADQDASIEEATQEAADTSVETGNATQQEIDWQRRYADLQPEYTRATQEASELRQERELYRLMNTSDDPDVRRQAAEALGYEIPEEDGASAHQQFVDEQARRDAAKAAEWISSFEQTAQQYQADQSAIEHINQQFPSIEKELGRELTQQEAQVIGDLAMANRDEQGNPQVGPASELVLGVLKNASQSRPRPRAPHFSAVGAEGTKAPNLDNRQERLDWMAEQLRANEQ